VLAICGSTRQSSSNHQLIAAITNLAADQFDVELLENLATIPHFNPDLDTDLTTAPEPVQEFRRKLATADGILICTPEYAMGVPGTLKNAIDWTVSSMHFSQKPVALITAATSGLKAHQSLLDTLHVIESYITTDTQLVISGIRVKVNAQDGITDKDIREQVKKLIIALAENMERIKNID
jgi:NAD(P)H-dependent FMN reductase